MRDPVLRSVETLVVAWRQEAAQRRRRTPTDPVAQTLESAATEVETVISDAEEASQTLSVPEYARAQRVNEATVRRWIHRGELDAAKDGAGDWRIARDARRHRAAKPRLHRAQKVS